MKIHTEILDSRTLRIIDSIKGISLLKDFYLSGGTGLSLQIGHRESIDLDFFSKLKFEPELLQTELQQKGELSSTSLHDDALNTFLDRVKLQFLYYPYDLLEDTYLWNGICVSSVIDIACTKLITISQRGSKKDFIDMHFLLQRWSLAELFELLDKKYKDIHYDHAHIVKSLVYFDDADKQPMPKMLVNLNWTDVKTSMLSTIKKFVF